MSRKYNVPVASDVLLKIDVGKQPNVKGGCV